TRGFFIEYANATNAGTTVTATLDNATGKFNWCAYGSDMPPNATVNAGGGYTLRGTKPFTINGDQTIDALTFGAGTCIMSIIDPTGRPDGFASPKPSLSSPNSPTRCNAGAVTLSATVSGGTTTAMTYTWTIGGNAYTNQTNSYTTASLTASAAYTVNAINANNCESNTESGNITVNYPGTNGQSAHAMCGCATGTTNCNGVCKTTGYTYSNGACTGNCAERWQVRTDQCGVANTTYAKVSDSTCTDGCVPTTDCAGCIVLCKGYKYAYWFQNVMQCTCVNEVAHSALPCSAAYRWIGNSWLQQNCGTKCLNDKCNWSGAIKCN
ncbi:MAG: hypothetical protein LBD87_01250, partial [Prevotellaceae bacterium]|nr:hypothetical protein [Prevotellaceae bacterium]